VAQFFGKFRLFDRLGGGQICDVFRAGRSWQADGRHVALKRIKPVEATRFSGVQLVVREAEILASLSHPNLCACHEVGVVDGCAFLTMDLVDGCTLLDLMRYFARRRVELPLPTITTIAVHLSEILDYLHRHCPTPLAHLDLSPQNVMISRQGEIKLIDFGIARLLEGSTPPSLRDNIMGTLGYMAPEQTRGEACGPQADQFGLGILLWEMITRRRWAHAASGRDEVTALPNGDLGPLVRRLLALKPADRFADLAEPLALLRGMRSVRHNSSRPLAALVQCIREPPNRRWLQSEPANAQLADGQDDHSYDALEILVDHGEETPSAMLRSAFIHARRANSSMN